MHVRTPLVVRQILMELRVSAALEYQNNPGYMKALWGSHQSNHIRALTAGSRSFAVKIHSGSQHILLILMRFRKWAAAAGFRYLQIVIICICWHLLIRNCCWCDNNWHFVCDVRICLAVARWEFCRVPPSVSYSGQNFEIQLWGGWEEKWKTRGFSGFQINEINAP